VSGLRGIFVGFVVGTAATLDTQPCNKFSSLSTSFFKKSMRYYFVNSSFFAVYHNFSTIASF